MSGFRRSIATALLLVLSGLPAAGSVCAILCDNAPSTAVSHHHHHNHGSALSQAAESASGVVGVVPVHDCSDHEPKLSASLAAADRADLRVAPSTACVIPAVASLADRAVLSISFDSSPPPKVQLPSSSPTVLRI